MSNMAVRVIDPTQPRLLTVEEWVQHHSQLLPELSFSVGRLWMRQG
jgi:hypothetical protein